MNVWAYYKVEVVDRWYLSYEMAWYFISCGAILAKK